MKKWSRDEQMSVDSCAESGKSVTRGQQNSEVFSVATWAIISSRKTSASTAEGTLHGRTTCNTDLQWRIIERTACRLDIHFQVWQIVHSFDFFNLSCINILLQPIFNSLCLVLFSASYKILLWMFSPAKLYVWFAATLDWCQNCSSKLSLNKN